MLDSMIPSQPEGNVVTASSSPDQQSATTASLLSMPTRHDQATSLQVTQNIIRTPRPLSCKPDEDSANKPNGPAAATVAVPSGSNSDTRALPINEDLADLFSENVIAKIYRTATKTVGIPHTFPEYVPQLGHGTGIYAQREAEFWTCGFFPGSMHCLLERLVRFPHSVRLDGTPSRAASVVHDNPHQLHALQTVLKQQQPYSRLQEPKHKEEEEEEEQQLEALGKPPLPRLRTALSALCALWAEPIHSMSRRTDTHDVGFIVMPSLRPRWELHGDRRSLDSITSAARALATRFVPAAGAIRSWDSRVQKNLVIEGLKDNLLVIIDSMCNLDLLYYAAGQLGADDAGARLAEVATTHATTLLRTHLRPEPHPPSPTATTRDGRYAGQWYSTHHVANLDPRTGAVKRHFTAQGYSDTSQWARGQAWAILGYAQTHMWTRDRRFLDAACGLAEYFLYRLDTHPGDGTWPSTAGGGSADAKSKNHKGGRYVPPWDFDATPGDGNDVGRIDQSGPSAVITSTAPQPPPAFIPRDSSAGVIAANGMLVLSQALRGGDSSNSSLLADRFLRAAVDIVRDTLLFAAAPERAELLAVTGPGAGGSYYRHTRIEVADVGTAAAGRSFESILKHGTANNNPNAPRRYSDHGLVYADYYLLEFGNRLLRMGLV